MQPDTSPEAVGARLVAVREARSLIQGTLAAQLGVSYQRLGQWERGARKIPPDMLGRIWQITGAGPDYILLGLTDHLPFELAQALREAERRSDGAA